MVKVAVPVPKKTKLGPRTVDFVLVGYANNSSASRFLVHKFDNPDIHANIFIESRNVSFFEDIFPYKVIQEPSSNKRTYNTTFNNNQESIND